MRLTVQILQDYVGQFPCIVFSIQNQKYLFNISETFARFNKDNRVKLNTGFNIFLTRISSQTIPGLFRLLLNLNHQSKGSDTKIYGPDLLVPLFDKIKFRFGLKIMLCSFYSLFNNQFILGFKNSDQVDKFFELNSYACFYANTNEYLHNTFSQKYVENVNDARLLINKNGSFQDENVEIVPIEMISGNSANDKLNNNGIEKKAQQQEEVKKVEEEQKKDKDQLYNEKNTQFVSYIVKTKPITSKISQQKLTELNFPKNKIGQLQKLKQMEIGGKIYKIEDIAEEEQPGSVVFIIDCNQTSQIESLISNKQFLQFADDSKEQKNYNLKLIIHLGNKHIITQDLYKEWMLKFNKAEHIFVDGELREIVNNKEQMKTLLKNFKYYGLIEQIYKYFPNFCIDKKQFEVASLRHQTPDSLQGDKSNFIEQLFDKLKLKQLSKKFFEYVISEKTQTGYYPLQGIFQDASIYQLPESKKPTQYKPPQNLISKEELPFNPQIIFLGTGCQKFSSYRAVSCIYIRDPKTDEGIMLDCGEASSYQFIQHFGLERAKQLLAKLKFIFISHQHSDHSSGIHGILKLRNDYINECKENISQLYILTPITTLLQITNYNNFIEKQNVQLVVLEELNELYDANALKDNYLFQYGILDLAKFVAERPNTCQEFKNEMTKFGIKKIITIPVFHCVGAHGIVVEYANGFKITYSGDARPCEKLAEVGANANIFIHEATYSQNELQHAISNNHSTIVEAIQLAMKAKAKMCILTHFSTRYQKVNFQNEVVDPLFCEYLFNNTICAFDHMQFNLSEIKLLPEISKIISEFYENDDED